MRKTTILLVVLLATLTLKKSCAQFVTIPDANFVTWLNAHGYSTCLNGNQLDTTCLQVVSPSSITINSSNISNLTGLQYFDHLVYLSCSNNQLTSLPRLPLSLQTLFCSSNQLTTLPALP
ncbi:MAG: hypothetical protein ABI772_14550, partial [Bacteroidota bacterium]